MKRWRKEKLLLRFVGPEGAHAFLYGVITAAVLIFSTFIPLCPFQESVSQLLRRRLLAGRNWPMRHLKPVS